VKSAQSSPAPPRKALNFPACSLHYQMRPIEIEGYIFTQEIKIAAAPEKDSPLK
jgi:hypothetical protein